MRGAARRRGDGRRRQDGRGLAEGRRPEDAEGASFGSGVLAAAAKRAGGAQPSRHLAARAEA